MRKLVVGSGLFLVISGLILHYVAEWETFTGWSAISTLHIWAGIVFVVIFPMYAWDHIRTNRRRFEKRLFGFSFRRNAAGCRDRLNLLGNSVASLRESIPGPVNRNSFCPHFRIDRQRPPAFPDKKIDCFLLDSLVIPDWIQEQERVMPIIPDWIQEQERVIPGLTRNSELRGRGKLA